MSSTAIAWTNETWNPVTGCSHVSEGCRNCYAEALSLRHGWTKKPWTAPNAAENIRLHQSRLAAPLHWKKPRLVFVNSMSDLFHDLVPVNFVARVWRIMASCPRHTFQVLTKRAERMATVVPQLAEEHTAPNGSGWPLPNVWLGVSCEDQQNADERIPFLLDTRAAVRFISAEPLLGPIDLIRLGSMDDGQGGHMAPDALAGGWWHKRGRAERWIQMEPGPHLDWVITGGESGLGHREMEIEWFRSLHQQCTAAGVPFFAKQDSGPRPGKQGRIPDELWVQEFPRTREPVST